MTKPPPDVTIAEGTVVILPVVVIRNAHGHTRTCEPKASTGATSDAYRRGWDSIFGARQEVGRA